MHAPSKTSSAPPEVILSGSVGEKFPGQTGSLEFFTALPDKIFCLGLSSHSWPSGKFVYARYARYTNSNALLWLRLSSIDVFCPHFVRAKNRPSGLKRLSSPRQILLLLTKLFSDISFCTYSFELSINFIISIFELLSALQEF